jgi:hypothetical protein
MEAIYSFETSVKFYRTTWHNTQEVSTALYVLVRKCQLKKGLRKYLLVSVLQWTRRRKKYFLNYYYYLLVPIQPYMK